MTRRTLARATADAAATAAQLLRHWHDQSLDSVQRMARIHRLPDGSWSVAGRSLFGYREWRDPSGDLSGDEERFEHLTHFRQLVVSLEAARVG